MATGNWTFSEVLTTSFVCNGPQGADGQAGTGSGPLTDIFDEATVRAHCTNRFPRARSWARTRLLIWITRA